jgi:TPR repeat protein
MKKCPVCQSGNHDTVKKCRYCGEWFDKQENFLNEEPSQDSSTTEKIKTLSLTDIRKAAEQGDTGAQFNLGWMYRKGKGVPQDDSEAVNWYRKAAEQGDVCAQANLGWMYDNAKGVSQDDSEAVNWYRKAAEQGLGSAQYNLGVMYEIGKGVSRNYSEAANWYRKAAEQGDADAQLRLDKMKDKLLK